MRSGYDVFGDVHGQFHKLEALLLQLGYEKVNGVYQHADYTAVFVGDIIDRGSEQIACLNTVRAMVEAGSALMVMGNHEYNAIAWATPDPEKPGDFLRTHEGVKGENNRHQHQVFLDAMEGDDALYEATLAWFKTLPLWLDLGGIQVVHACWSPYYMDKLKPLLTPQMQLTDELIVASARKGSVEYEAIETLLKGPEAALPEGFFFQDKDGCTRHEVRIKWWSREGRTYQELALPAAGDEYVLPDADVVMPKGIELDLSSKPIFFGHYWMTGKPQLQAPHIACVDYSAAKDGPLVAYRWQGEAELRQEHLIYLV